MKIYTCPNCQTFHIGCLTKEIFVTCSNCEFQFPCSPNGGRDVTDISKKEEKKTDIEKEILKLIKFTVELEKRLDKQNEINKILQNQINNIEESLEQESDDEKENDKVSIEDFFKSLKDYYNSKINS